MNSMPTAFLLTAMSDSPLVEVAQKWGWQPWRRAAGDLVFVADNGEIVRVMRSARRAANLRPGTRIYLGPLHHECEGTVRLIETGEAGVYRVDSQKVAALA